MKKYLLKSENDFAHLFACEAWGEWSKRELQDIKPKMFPCVVLISWPEGCNGSYLSHEIIYLEDFENA